MTELTSTEESSTEESSIEKKTKEQQITEQQITEQQVTEQQVKKLKKENQRLQKQLARNQRNLDQLCRSRQQSESLLSKTIQELQTSRSTLSQRSQELEQALSDVQSMQSRLLMAEKMSALGVLVAGVAHEINNPVNFIYGNIEHTNQYCQDLLTLLSIYQSCYPNPVTAVQDYSEEIDLGFLAEDLPKTLGSMKMGAERIKQIVLSLRTFSRMDEAEYKTVDLHQGLDSTLVILDHRVKESGEKPGIQITKNYGNIPSIACYAGQINQVFMNILVNAIDALEENKTQNAEIIISTVSQPEHITVTITDNGPGIPKDIQPKIFDPFFTTKAVGKGTGMGMAISYQIVVDKHHGQLTCEASPENGTTFTIRLPLMPPDSHIEKESSDPEKG